MAPGGNTSEVSEEQVVPEKPVLLASVHNVRHFAAILRSINLANRATINVTSKGFTVVVEEARVLLATAFVFKEIFNEYSYNHPGTSGPYSQDGSANDGQEEDRTSFEVPLSILIDCLNIFGASGNVGISNGSSKGKRWNWADDGSDQEPHNDARRGQRNGRGDGFANVNRIDRYFGGSEKGTSMRMAYAGPGYPLTLLLAEDASGPTTTCEITTFEPESNYDMPFDGERIILKLILKSSWLRDALSELDPSCEKLTFIANPLVSASKPSRGVSSRPLFRIQVTGTFGSTEMDYPNDKEVLETFECGETVHFVYRFSHISKTLRALQNSSKTSLRIDAEGMLSLQFLMPTPGPRGVATEGFVDFRCQALDENV